MFISNLTLKKTSGEEIRSISFKKGLNIITDSGDSSLKANSLGKTTVLKLIDICLGSKHRKYLYYDPELNSTNTVVEKFIIDNKVYAEMEICDNLDNPVIKHTLSVELFPRGKRKINNQVFIEKDYQKELKEIIFENTANTPTFRQLIGMFVRVGQKDDNNKFLKYIEYNIASEVYANIYSYLFRLDDTAISEQSLALKTEVKKKINRIKEYKFIHSIENENIMKQQLISLTADLQNVEDEMKILSSSDAFRKNSLEIQNIRKIYTQLIDEIDANEFKLLKLKSNLNKSKIVGKSQVDLNVLENLYTETSKNLGNLQKEFIELVKFNESLTRNKIDYYTGMVEKYQSKVNKLKDDMNNFFDENSKTIMLIENNQVEEYQSLELQRDKLIESRGRLLEVKEKYEALLLELKEVNKTLAELPESSQDINDITAAFNIYFRKYSEVIIKEKFILYPTGQEFPFGISNDDSGLSTGTKKSAIAAFDLAYQSYSNDLNIPGPRFIVHDVIETMDKVAIDGIITTIDNIDCQYIVAILSDKLIDSEKVTPDDIRLKLSIEEKLFKV